MCIVHIAKSCTFYVHTMKHQAAMNSKPLQVEICSRPSQITVDRIMNKVLEVLKLQDEAKKYFSIWLTSPQLRTYINHMFSYTICQANLQYFILLIF